jgi:conjugative relaxase-like TrwC/TraI family protein
MSSVNTHKLTGNAKDVADYYVKDLVRYYLSADVGGQELPYATWKFSDEFCEALGIHRELLSRPEYLKKIVLRLLEGKNSAGGFLSDQFAPPNRSMLGEDIVFAAPKSVSSAFALADEPTRFAIEAAHRRAVDKAIERIKKDLAFSRRGKGGAERIPADIGFFCVHQTDARPTSAGSPPMPHLHTHTLLPNIAICSDGKIRAIDYRGLDALAYSTAYQREFAAALREAGFVLRQGRHAFEIATISDDLIDKFSPRSAEIKKAAAEIAEKNGRDFESLSSSERKLLERRVQKYKFDKSEEFDGIDACLPIWRERAGEDAPADVFGGEKADREACLEKCREKLQEIAKSIAVLDRSKVDTLIAANTLAVDCSDAERAKMEQDIFDEFFIEAESFRKMSAANLEGPADGAPIQRAVSRIALEAECHALKVSEKMAVKKYDFAIDIEAALADKILTDEQADAIRGLADGQQIEFLRGGAGVGKTYALSPLVEAHLAAGGRVFGTAVANKIAFALTEAGVDEKSAMSLTKLSAMIANEKIQLDSKTMIIIDEASMVGLRELNQVLDAVDRSGARVILVGDDSQIGAVGLQSLEIIQEGLRRAGVEERSILSTIRQKTETEKALAAAFRNGVEVDTALQFLDEQDRLKIGKNRDHTLEMCLRRWNEMRDAGIGHVFIAATNREAQEIAIAVRHEREKRGDLSGEEVSVPILGNGGLDDEPENSMLLRTGDRIRFYDRVTEYTGRRPRNVAVNGTVARFVGVETDDKGKRFLIAEHVDKYDRVQRDEVAVAARARELAAADRKKGKAWEQLSKKDREIWLNTARKDESLPPSRFRVDLEKIRDKETKRFRLSYSDSSTAHSSQGISTKRSTPVIIDGTSTLNAALGYIITSRQEDEFTIIANSEAIDSDIRRAGVSDRIERHDRVSALARAFTKDSVRPFVVNLIDYKEKEHEELRIKIDRQDALPSEVIRGVLRSGRKIADFQKGRASTRERVEEAQLERVAGNEKLTAAIADLKAAMRERGKAIGRFEKIFERSKEKLVELANSARERLKKAKEALFGNAIDRIDEAKLEKTAGSKKLEAAILDLKAAMRERGKAIEELRDRVSQNSAEKTVQTTGVKAEDAANSNKRLEEVEKEREEEALARRMRPNMR